MTQTQLSEFRTFFHPKLTANHIEKWTASQCSHNSSKEFETRRCIIDELKELCYMAVRPHVMEVLMPLLWN